MGQAEAKNNFPTGEKTPKRKGYLYVIPIICMLFSGYFVIPKPSNITGCIMDYVFECNAQYYVCEATSYGYKLNLLVSSRTEQNFRYASRCQQPILPSAISYLTTASILIIRAGNTYRMLNNGLKRMCQLMDIPPPLK